MIKRSLTDDIHAGLEGLENGIVLGAICCALKNKNETI